MEKIASFTVDHNKLERGMYISRVDGDVTTYDIRTRKPNVEEVMENEYFKDKRIQVSIFMNLFNVHANWFPVDGHVIDAQHFDGNFHKAWLPKAAAENEHADILIKATNGETVLCRQIAGAMARRIVTYARKDDDCYIDEHLGFIKFGSRVDLFLPIDSEICVKMGQITTGDQTVVAKMKSQAD